jgi:hypothetical protein
MKPLITILPSNRKLLQPRFTILQYDIGCHQYDIGCQKLHIASIYPIAHIVNTIYSQKDSFTISMLGNCQIQQVNVRIPSQSPLHNEVFTIPSPYQK